MGGSRQIKVKGPAVYNARVAAAIQSMRNGIWPNSLVIVGDSTGNENNEWVRLMSEAMAVRFVNSTVNYRVFSGTTLQYESIENLSVGSAGLAKMATGTSVTANMRYVVADDAATSPVGDLDVRCKLALNGALFSANGVLCGKYAGAGLRSWRLEMTTTGALTFTHSADGTATIVRTSTAVVTELNNPIWVRATLDVDNGAAGNTCTFYTSTNGTTWVALGTASTIAGVTSIFNSTSNTQWPGASATSIAQQDHLIHFYEFQVYASLTGASRIISIDIGGVMHYDMVTFPVVYDDQGNLLTIAGTERTFSGSPRVAIFNASVSGAVIAYTTTNYNAQIIGKPAMVMISYGHNDTSDVEYRTDYKALTDALLVTNSDMAIVAVIQNLRTLAAGSSYNHRIRMDQVQKFAAAQGFGVLDIQSIWNDALTDVDGIHPIPAGSLVWAIAAIDILEL